MYKHSRLRRGIVAFDGTAILVELRWKCAPSTSSIPLPPLLPPSLRSRRRRRWYSGPVISRRLTIHGRVHARERRVTTLSNLLAEKIRILKYED